MKDFLGQPLVAGDKIVLINSRYGGPSLELRIVKRVTDVTVFFQDPQRVEGFEQKVSADKTFRLPDNFIPIK